MRSKLVLLLVMAALTVLMVATVISGSAGAVEAKIQNKGI